MISPRNPQDKANLLRNLQPLVSQYVPEGKTIDATLDELAEKWNPLFANSAKKEFVEDVNTLVRDYLRPIRRSLLDRTPDLKRIHSLAEQLCTSRSLAQIKKRGILMSYIGLYIIKCLQGNLVITGTLIHRVRKVP